jgi:predicted transcriptional regulator of viral defense system
MTTLKDTIIEAGFADHILTDVDLNNLFNGTPAARYGMVNKALKKEELIKIRRGLYLLAERYRHKKLSKFFLASRIASHSYVSLESALSYHGWIPERVTTVTSVLAIGRTKKFITSFGEFVFYYLPVNEYEFLTGITRVEEIKGEPFLLASPLRALADLVYVKKIDWEGMQFFTHSLRIDIEQLMQINADHFLEIKNVYRSTRVLQFLDNLKKELKK